MDYYLGDAGMSYIRRKRLCLVALSVSQIILGVICTLLWLASYEFCTSCAYTIERNGANTAVDYSWYRFCGWLLPMQGVWGGVLIFSCGLASVSYSCFTSRCMNSKVIFIAAVTLLGCFGMVALDALIMTGCMYFEEKTNFLNNCLIGATDFSAVWYYFHGTILVIGTISAVQALTCFIMTSYAQCGCCGMYCSEDRSTSTRTDDQNTARYQLLYSSNAASSNSRVRPDRNYVAFPQAPYSGAVEGEERQEQPVTVDDLIQLDPQDGIAQGQSYGVENENMERNVAMRSHPPPPYSVSG